VSGETSLLRLAIGVMAEAYLLLQVEDESPDFTRAYYSHVGAQAAATEEVVEVSHAVDDDCRGVWAFSFGGGAQPVTFEEAGDVGVGI